MSSRGRPAAGSDRVQNSYFSAWEKRGNPYWVWMQIGICCRWGLDFPDWVKTYLAQCAERMTTPDAARERDLRKALPRIFGFPKNSRGSARSNWSALPILPVVAELMLGHRQRGIIPVYDTYTYFQEQRAGFEAWCAKLRSIVEPAPDNVIKLERA